jgi:hypothetical protein
MNFHARFRYRLLSFYTAIEIDTEMLLAQRADKKIVSGEESESQ